MLFQKEKHFAALALGKRMKSVGFEHFSGDQSLCIQLQA